MTFLEKLEYLMKKYNIKNLHELSTKCKIPYSTLRGFYTKGTDNIKLHTLRTLSKFFMEMVKLMRISKYFKKL